MVGRAASVLTSRRVAAFVAVAAVVVTWFIVAPHLAAHRPLAGDPARLDRRAAGDAAARADRAAALARALALSRRDRARARRVRAARRRAGASPANFAKLWAAIFAGWAFVRLFEELSWVVLVAFVIPLVDIISVYRGPTKAITEHHFEVYTAVAIAFVVPGGGGRVSRAARRALLRALPRGGRSASSSASCRRGSR